MEEILWFVSRAAGLVSLLMLTGTVVLGCAHATRASSTCTNPHARSTSKP